MRLSLLISVLLTRGTFTFFIFMLFFSPCKCDPELMCGASMPQDEDVDSFVKSFLSVMDSISRIVKHKHIGYSESSWPQVYGLAQCYDFLDSRECNLCFAKARNSISRCLPYNSGRTYLDGCFLRYDTFEFFQQAVDPTTDKVECGDPNVSSNDRFNKLDFIKKVNVLVSNVTARAPLDGGHAYASVTGDVHVYAMAQCLESINDTQCRSCLMDGGPKVTNCAPGADGKAFYSGCFIIYSTQEVKPTAGCQDNICNLSGSSLELSKVMKTPVAIASCSSVFFIFAVIGAYTGYNKFSLKKKVKSKNSKEEFSLNFRYELLEKATDSFAEARKVGQGGAGSVFRGTLADGKTVAVKRLFFNTSQWVDMLFNEVNFISGARHKNLVRLLGCSIEGPQCLLVYEYLPNRSLDQVLFWKNTTHILSWKQRYDIILGVAEGLEYLHNGTKVKIIHRDIKCSNILLDQNLEPKIADFGLVRCGVTDRTHVSTEIKGTLGYVAPEYLVHGQLTEKADVYSFGILVIEIATGRKNSALSQGSGSVLHKVWKNYTLNKVADCVEPGLRGKFPVEEAANVLQIGLLCTQAPIALRPTMVEVVKMLKDKNYVVPTPKQPPFLNASVLNPDDCFDDSCCVDIANLDQQAKPEATSTEAKT